MTQDTVNGVALLLTDIQGQLDNKRLSQRDRIVYRSLEYMLKSLPPLREDVENLKSVSWGYRSWLNPKKAFAVVFILYSFVISDIREPVFYWLGGVFKIVFSAF